MGGGTGGLPGRGGIGLEDYLGGGDKRTTWLWREGTGGLQARGARRHEDYLAGGREDRSTTGWGGQEVYLAGGDRRTT